ncbi:bacterial transcriptional activator domain-containing protein [Streptomyces sp. NBC_01013]|uniref:bacterial transcriptional activator domain-containing protein n=1 Tax=Streptomyces sp. NBC_01013 TaxID=2903718 RepID=UPI003869C276
MDVEPCWSWDEDWVLLEREHLRQLRLHALDEPAETLIPAGQTVLAIEAAWASVRAESLRVSTHRAVVSAHLAEGNAGEAVRHYEAFCHLLATILGVVPSHRFARMLSELPSPGSGSGPSTTPTPSPRWLPSSPGRVSSCPAPDLRVGNGVRRLSAGHRRHRPRRTERRRPPATHWYERHGEGGERTRKP